MSSTVAPPFEKPVDVFTKSAPAFIESWQRADLLLVGQQRRLEDHLAQRAAVLAGLDDAADVAGDEQVVLAP